jgi:hypothetical protein
MPRNKQEEICPFKHMHTHTHTHTTHWKKFNLIIIRRGDFQVQFSFLQQANLIAPHHSKEIKEGSILKYQVPPLWLTYI